MNDIEAIERATLAAVPPERTEELPGWLLGLDKGTVGRAHSAVPLGHDAPDLEVIPEIEARYARAGFKPVLRIPDGGAFEPVRTHLRADGFAPAKPTLVQVAAASGAAAPASHAHVHVNMTPDDAWAGVFLGEGFDPVDGASRVAILRRARAAVFARAVVDGQTVAVGSACFSHGWCGIHGMRTAPAWRGRGFAQAILAALEAQARSRGISRLFLQVEAENTAAQALYRRRGFTSAWSYTYWQRPQV
ncbi:GNAT family N-acetyltransferase [Caenimonas sedimenti]|uniref:GNAT family N-acetyltransferase n=2 Tax=Caenimonas sedimenti TaxID=2596921 RepID=A0A562ZY13_9BURK|nr:GNAT family N-acetyltransferase [Caenimonas sedimenti]